MNRGEVQRLIEFVVRPIWACTLLYKLMALSPDAGKRSAGWVNNHCLGQPYWGGQTVRQMWSWGTSYASWLHFMSEASNCLDTDLQNCWRHQEHLPGGRKHDRKQPLYKSMQQDYCVSFKKKNVHTSILSCSLNAKVSITSHNPSALNNFLRQKEQHQIALMKDTLKSPLQSTSPSPCDQHSSFLISSSSTAFWISLTAYHRLPVNEPLLDSAQVVPNLSFASVNPCQPQLLRLPFSLESQDHCLNNLSHEPVLTRF